MKLRLAAACAALSCLALSSAQAAVSVPITATLAAPVPHATEVIAGGTIFQCEGSTCVARSADRTHFSLDACKQLVRRVGQVTAFASSARTLDEAKLTRCNAVAR